MDLGRRHERTRSTPALHQALALKLAQCMTGGHKTYVMNLCQLSLGIHGIAGLEMPFFNPLPYRALDSLVSWGPVSIISRQMFFPLFKFVF